MAGAKTKRYRLSVPVEDKLVNKWLSVQANISWSIRVLIREQIRNAGITDVTCGPVAMNMNRTSRAGRPTKEMLAARDRAMMDALGIEQEENEFDQVPEPVPEAAPEPAVVPKAKPAADIWAAPAAKSAESPVVQTAVVVAAPESAKISQAKPTAVPPKVVEQPAVTPAWSDDIASPDELLD